MKSKLFLGFTLFLSAIFLVSIFPIAGFASASDQNQGQTTLTLRDCYQLALRQSEKIAMSYEDIEATEAQFFKASSEALGDIDFVISNTRQEVQGSSSSGSSSISQTLTSSSRRERKFTFTQPIFIGFRSMAALGAAGSYRSQRKEEWNRAKQLLFLDVAKAFYDLLYDQKEIDILEQTHALLQDRTKDLDEREKIGRSRASEVATARSKMKRLEADLAKAHGQVAISRHLLSYLTGADIQPSQLNDADLTKDMQTALDAYIGFAETRPDVQAARQSMKTAWRGIIEAQSYLWPDINAEGNLYQKREGFQSGIDWDLLLKMTVPLFRGGETIGKIKEAVSVWKKQRYAFQLAQRDARLDIQKSYENWIASLSESKAFDDAVTASEENYNLQKDDYSKNLVNNLDVLDALESLNDTKRDANRAFYDMKENYWQLQIATGQCCESI